MDNEIKNAEVVILDVETMEFGAGTSPFSFISSTAWCMSDQSADTTYQTNVTVCNDGEYVPASVVAFGGKTEVSANYEAKEPDEIDMGTITVGTDDDLAIDSISISTKQGAKATVSVRAHKHTSGNHMARARTVGLPVLNGWGASDFGNTTGVDLECIQSGTYDVSFGHVDQPNNAGMHLIGITRQETHTMKFDYVSDSVPAEISGWTMTNTPDSETKSRDGFVSGSVTYVRYYGLTAPAP